MDRQVVKWTGEQLHDILGYSDKNLAEYICSLGAKAKTVEDLLENLLANDVPNSAATQSFCQSLYSKFGGGGKSTQQQQRQQRPKTNAELIRQSESYGLVDMGEEEEVGSSGGPFASSSSSSKK